MGWGWVGVWIGLDWVGFELGLEGIGSGFGLGFRLLGSVLFASAVSVLRFAILEICSSMVCFGSVLFASAVSVCVSLF